MNKIEAAIQCAQDRYCASSDDNIELDDKPQVSPVPKGIWVQAWLFVSNEDIAEELASDADTVADVNSIPPVDR